MKGRKSSDYDENVWEDEVGRMKQLQLTNSLLTKKIDSLTARIIRLESAAGLAVGPTVRYAELEKISARFSFNVRIRNAFKADELVYLEDLLGMSAGEVRLLPGIGRQSLREIQEKLHAVGLKLRVEHYLYG